MKKILLNINVPDGIKPEVIDIGYTTPAGNFESHRVYESEFKEITLPSEEELDVEFWETEYTGRPLCMGIVMSKIINKILNK